MLCRRTRRLTAQAPGKEVLLRVRSTSQRAICGLQRQHPVHQLVICGWRSGRCHRCASAAVQRVLCQSRWAYARPAVQPTGVQVRHRVTPTSAKRRLKDDLLCVCAHCNAVLCSAPLLCLAWLHQSSRYFIRGVNWPCRLGQRCNAATSYCVVSVRSQPSGSNLGQLSRNTLTEQPDEYLLSAYTSKPYMQ